MSAWSGVPVDAAVGLLIVVRYAGLDMISATELQQLYSRLAVVQAMTSHAAGRLRYLLLLLLPFDGGARPGIGKLQRPRVASVDVGDNENFELISNREFIQMWKPCYSAVSELRKIKKIQQFGVCVVRL